MFRIRHADTADLPIIHRMQDIPARERILVSPLPGLAEFTTKASSEMVAGHEFYYLLEQDSLPLGFIWISVVDETCEIWGRHLHTLFYACASIAFEKLNMPRLKWCVRQSNRRMLAVCERFHVRKTGEDSLCVIAERFEFIAIGNVNYYELRPEDYVEVLPLLEEYSMERSIFAGELPKTSWG